MTAYKRLSSLTAAARRNGTFPDLADHGREIARPLAFADADAALGWLRQAYRRDRTAGQSAAIYLGVEKDALVSQLAAWYDDLGLPVIALRGIATTRRDNDGMSMHDPDGWTAALLRELWARAAIPGARPGLDIDAIYLAEKDRVAIEFTAHQRPGERFGYLFPARPSPPNDPKQTPESWATVVMARLVEAVYASDLGGLPPAAKGDDTTWLPFAQ